MMSSNKRKDKKGRVLKKGESQKQDNLYMYRWTDHNRTRQCCYASTLEKLRDTPSINSFSISFSF